jgi:general secretion pathway protein H
MKNHKGFTLLELMIVLLIASVISGGVAIVVSAVSTPEKQLDEEGLRLFARMNFAIDEALMQRRLMGLQVARESIPVSYSWLQYENNRWQTVEEPLPTVELPEGIGVDLVIDDELIEALQENTLNNDDEDEALIPDIVFYPSSDISEFTLRLTLKDEQHNTHSFSIYIDERGQLSHSLMTKNTIQQ